MSKKLISASVVTFLALAGIVSADTSNKVAVCHLTSSDSNPTVEIVISQSALEAALAKGDYVIDADHPCGVVIGPE